MRGVAHVGGAVPAAGVRRASAQHIAVEESQAGLGADVPPARVPALSRGCVGVVEPDASVAECRAWRMMRTAARRCMTHMAARRPSPQRTAVSVDGAVDEVHELAHHMTVVPSNSLLSAPPQHRRHGQVHVYTYERAAQQPHGLTCFAWPTSRAASTHSLTGPAPWLRSPALPPATLAGPQAHVSEHRARARAAC
jgi:hypothetical protein